MQKEKNDDKRLEKDDNLVYSSFALAVLTVAAMALVAIIHAL